LFKKSFLPIIITLFSFSIIPVTGSSQVEFENLRIVNAFGDTIQIINPEQMVQITADVTNNSDVNQEFAFVFSIDNLDKHVIWVTGLLVPGQTLSPAISHSFADGASDFDVYLTLLPKDVLNPENPTDYSVFKDKSNQLANPLSISLQTGSQIRYDSSSESSVLTNQKVEQVPSWIKNNAKWWVNNEIDDAAFLAGIKYLIENGIITLTETQESKPLASFVDPQKDPQHYLDRYFNEQIYKEWFDKNYQDYTIYEAVGLADPDDKAIPDWIRNNAKWWSEDLITEIDFLNGIEYLIEKKIIQISI
jgi:hypothetical protein